MLPVNAASLHRQKIRLVMGYALGLDFSTQHIVLSACTLRRFSRLAFKIASISQDRVALSDVGQLPI